MAWHLWRFWQSIKDIVILLLVSTWGIAVGVIAVHEWIKANPLAYSLTVNLVLDQEKKGYPQQLKLLEVHINDFQEGDRLVLKHDPGKKFFDRFGGKTVEVKKIRGKYTSILIEELGVRIPVLTADLAGSTRL